MRKTLTTLISLSILIGVGLLALLLRPSPVPDALNPFRPLDPNAAWTIVTPVKLAWTTGRAEACMAAVAHVDGITPAPDQSDGETCHIRNAVEVRALSGARTSPFRTTCAIALRLHMWEAHRVRPAAQRLLGADLAEMQHFSSYSCRRIRTLSGSSGRMSEHATANAVDIAGFTLSDGRRIALTDWADPEAGPFLRDVRDGACDVFNAVLGPDYNSLHADHFHFDMGRWIVCR